MEKVTLIKYSEIMEHCGQPGDKASMVKKRFPFPLKLNGSPKLICRNFLGNEKIVAPVMDAFKEILDIYGLKFIQENQLDWYGGCFEDRPSRAGKRKSVHAWGMAVDYLPQMGRFNSPCLLPYHVVQAFKNRGFMWGGDWNHPDGMHFSSIIE